MEGHIRGGEESGGGPPRAAAQRAVVPEKEAQVLDGRCPAARATGGTRARAAPPSGGTGKPAHQGRAVLCGQAAGAPMPSARPPSAENGAQCALLTEEMDGEEEEGPGGGGEVFSLN